MEHKLLTLTEMVKYEIPVNYSLSTVNRVRSGWNLPKFFPCSILDRNKSNPSIKPGYVDVSREKQQKFLMISGKIIKTRRKCLSQSRAKVQPIQKPLKPNSFRLKSIQKHDISLKQVIRKNKLPVKKANFLSKIQIGLIAKIMK